MQNVVGNQHITLSPVLQGEVFQHTCEGHQDKHHGVPYSLHLLSYTKKAGIAKLFCTGSIHVHLVEEYQTGRMKIYPLSYIFKVTLFKDLQLILKEVFQYQTVTTFSP